MAGKILRMKMKGSTDDLEDVEIKGYIRSRINRLEIVLSRN